MQSIETKNNAVSRVTTDKGTIDCEIFVNSAGQVQLMYMTCMISYTVALKICCNFRFFFV